MIVPASCISPASTRVFVTSLYNGTAVIRGPCVAKALPSLMLITIVFISQYVSTPIRLA